MKMVEIKYRAEMNEMAKLNAKLERAEAKLAKKQAAAEKAGVADWTGEQHSAWLATVRTECGWIVNKEDIKKNGAWFDLFSAERELEDIKGRIERAEKRVEKVTTAVEEYRQQVAEIADLKTREELQKLEFEQEQKEWAKDGITLERRYAGITPQGKHFEIDGNNGVTMRSRHCYTLYLEGQGVVFTSGEFWRAYAVVKNS